MRLHQYIKKHEGLSLNLYYINEIPHIGWGHNLKFPITEFAADYILSNDIYAAQLYLQNVFSSILDIRIHVGSLERYAALVDMMFQLGIGSFKEFKLMTQAIKDECWETAAAEVLDSKYSRQHPTRAKENADLIRGKETNRETIIRPYHSNT